MSPSQSPVSRLNRALFWTKATMVWERLLPAIFPFVVLGLLIAAAGEWGLFLWVPLFVHLLCLAVGLLVTVIISVRALFGFRLPSFTEINGRLATDNGLKPERLIAMRHEVVQPKLKIGKAKAGIATADPFALRYVAIAAIVLGLLINGPVPLSRVQTAFFPGSKPIPVLMARLSSK